MGEISPKEKQRLRSEGGWYCPVCGPTEVTPVDDPTSRPPESTPPHCAVCGTSLNQHPDGATWADHTFGQFDTRRKLDAMYGKRDSFTFEKIEEDDEDA